MTTRAARPADWLVRAGWQLLAGAAVGVGAVGVVAVLITAVVVILGTDGATTGNLGLVGAVAAGVGVTGIFFALGHLVQVACARIDVRLLLAVSLVTYVTQVLQATLLVRALTATGLDGVALTGGVVAGVLGWISGLGLTFRRLRIPVFDPPESNR